MSPEDEVFDAPEWCEALTLAERAALLAADPGGGVPADAVRRAAEMEARWRREAELTDDGLFAAHLAAGGLTVERFRRVLAEPAAGLRRRLAGRPRWLHELALAYSAPRPPLPAAPDDAGDGGDDGTLEWLWPLAAAARQRLLEGLRRAAGPGALEPERLTASLLPALLDGLRRASERVLALELQISRIEGRLAGETPEARFHSFVTTLREPAGAVTLLRRYPVLARDACRRCCQWVAASLEMMERCAADRAEIVRRFAAGTDPGPVVAAATGLGDRHAGGRAVAVLRFASGLRLVYKPRPLAVDERFQQLLAWLADRDAATDLRRLTVCDRGDHGWMEHVAAAPCASAAEVARFYRRQGAWIALLYALEANDFHHENLIAAGEHPVPIDLETLFQPARPAPDASGPGFLPTDLTVLNSGLLPRRFWATAQEGGLDLSGMGGQGGERVGMRRIAGRGTDEMRWALVEERLPTSANVPTLDGAPVVLWQQAGAVLEGFRATYRLLWRHRDALLAAHGPLAAFAALPVRTLLRGTGVYVHLLHVGHHPDYLQNALQRDRLYDRLWLDATVYPPLRATVQAEHRDLMAGDVPLWRAISSARDLLHAGGQAEGGADEAGTAAGERIDGWFAASGMERVRDRLGGLGEDDLERQCWLIQASLEATRSFDERWSWPATSLPAATTLAAAAPARFLAAARTIGDRVARLAVEQGDLVTWFHLEPRPDGWVLGPVPVDLYHGLAGMAIFFAHLARLAGEERYERLARLALGTARRRSAATPQEPTHPGVFDGWGGLVYALTHLGALWGEAELLAEAESLAVARIGEIDGDLLFDLVAGAAGTAAALLALHRHRPSAVVLAAARRCGDRLLAGAQASERGLGWPPYGEAAGPPLTGFGHGAAGIAWALARLALASSEERFRDAATAALRYERGWFSPEHDNWPDLRRRHRDLVPSDYLHAWCYGASGIGLGRTGMLGCLGIAENAGLAAEIRAAVRSTLASGFGANHSLCHGDLGNLELVREAGRALADAELAAETERLGARILAVIETSGPRCGAALKTESLGIMTGLSGIGYGLLRCAFPERVPCLLLLDTPAAA